ncbi:hypothetical protein ABZ135_31375 [Streptomyces sp. NPDC006339]|uniref:hypothetical protein n=1 Tax=Streptomyces sp. NPDC006339 TaxID=3156755 RepID=UPI0033AF195A
MTTSQSNTPLSTRRRPGSAFAAAHGPSARWTTDTCALYVELFSTPPIQRTPALRKATR